MAVYVDDLFPTRRTRRWPYVKACHMIADSRLELFEMANTLYLDMDWLQRGGRLEHFDLTSGKRIHALRAGAIPLDRQDFVTKMKAVRRAAHLSPVSGLPGTPEAE